MANCRRVLGIGEIAVLMVVFKRRRDTSLKVECNKLKKGTFMVKNCEENRFKIIVCTIYK